MPPTFARLREAPTTATPRGHSKEARARESDIFGSLPGGVMNENFSSVQEIINYRFGQVKLLELALSHSSWANERGCPEESNERLEFLGDAVLELCVSEEAYRRFPECDEGLLTKQRSRLVKTSTLAGVARGIGLNARLLLGRGEEAQGGRERDALLADALEALFGAVFLDGGFDAARGLILALLEPLWPDTPALPGGKDCKSRLQELTQETHRERPVYRLVDSSGPEHHKVFDVEVLLPDGRGFRATGPSLKKAEQAAAKAAIDALVSQAAGQ
jgi:ribonuclease-3